jgi:hypothetical protein
MLSSSSSSQRRNAASAPGESSPTSSSTRVPSSAGAVRGYLSVSRRIAQDLDPPGLAFPPKARREILNERCVNNASVRTCALQLCPPAMAPGQPRPPAPSSLDLDPHLRRVAHAACIGACSHRSRREIARETSISPPQARRRPEDRGCTAPAVSRSRSPPPSAPVVSPERDTRDPTVTPNACPACGARYPGWTAGATAPPP